MREDLTVEVKRDRLLIQRGKAELGVFPGEIRYLVNALAEGAARLVEQENQGSSIRVTARWPANGQTLSWW